MLINDLKVYKSEVVGIDKAQLKIVNNNMLLQGKRAAVVDDDAAVRNLLLEFLGLYGCEVECSDNGRDALDLLKNRRYDFLITDADMPGIDGITLTKKVRDFGLSLLIIGTSGTSGEEDFLTAGADFFLGKPISLGRLKGILRKEFFIDNP